MAEVLGHKSRVAGGFAQPGRGGMAQGVRRHVLGDLGEDRRLQARSAEATEDRVLRLGPALLALVPQAGGQGRAGERG
jgi:hypothetical protein